MDHDKVMEEEEEEEKEHFFADIVPSERDPDRERDDDDDDDDGDVDMSTDEPRPAPASTSGTGAGAGSVSASTGGSGAASSSAPTASVTPAEHERRAQIGASPYLAPFTPLSSPSNRPKTPSSVSASQRSGSGGSSSRKPQLVPVKGTGNGPAQGGMSGGNGSASKALVPEDVVQHLPHELVDALMGAVQTLDKLILGVDDFKADQLGFLTDKVNSYVDLLQQIDSAGANYHALIPLQVLEMLDGETETNPELFTKTQLEKCDEESTRAAGRVDTLELLKAELEAGLTELP